jgi:hypothetical protein
MRRYITAIAASLLALTPASAQGVNQTRPVEKADHIDIYVTPYYEAAETPGGKPRVAVNNGLNELLASNDPKDILAGRDLVQSNPATITPFSLMVLAIRLYDTGQRDDSVLWFYIAKYRAITLVEAITFTSGPASDGVMDAIGSFISLAGPYFNSYAFCDPDKQARANTAAIDWVEAHPYQTIFAPALASRAKSKDLNASIRTSIASLRASAAEEAKQMSDPAYRKNYMETRKNNGTEARFCW